MDGDDDDATELGADTFKTAFYFSFSLKNEICARATTTTRTNKIMKIKHKL